MQENKSVPRILITGATGFVGPCLLAALATSKLKHAEVFVWTHNPAGVADKNPLNVDIRCREAVFASIAAIRPTHIVHLAAQSHVPTSFKQPELTWAINVMGTLNLLEAVKSYVPEAGILYVSSSEVYGKSFQKDLPLDEGALLQPQNPYAASKAAADLMAGQYAAQGLRIVRMRPFNHIGVGQREEFVVPAFAAQIAKIEAGWQDPVLRVGNLEAQRDFLDVRDVVRAYVMALEHIFELPRGLVLNVCSGVPRKIADILSGLIDQASCPVTIAEDPERLRPSDTPVAVGVADAAHRYLGWTPEIAFKKTLLAVLNEWRDKLSAGTVAE